MQVQKMLSGEEIRSLKPKDREEYIGSVVLDILKTSPRGVTVPEVCEKTGFYRDTVSKQLERLVSTREAYKVVRGGLTVYHKNGKVVHECDTKNTLMDANRFYSFYRLRNEEGNFIYVQEKEIDDLRAVRVMGGIMINEKFFLKFINELNGFALEDTADE